MENKTANIVKSITDKTLEKSKEVVGNIKESEELKSSLEHIKKKALNIGNNIKSNIYEVSERRSDKDKKNLSIKSKIKTNMIKVIIGIILIIGAGFIPYGTYAIIMESQGKDGYNHPINQIFKMMVLNESVNERKKMYTEDIKELKKYATTKEEKDIIKEQEKYIKSKEFKKSLKEDMYNQLYVVGDIHTMVRIVQIVLIKTGLYSSLITGVIYIMICIKVSKNKKLNNLKYN